MSLAECLMLYRCATIKYPRTGFLLPSKYKSRVVATIECGLVGGRLKMGTNQNDLISYSYKKEQPHNQRGTAAHQQLSDHGCAREKKMLNHSTTRIQSTCTYFTILSTMSHTHAYNYKDTNTDTYST